MNQTSIENVSDNPEIDIEKASLDFTSVRVQFGIGLVICLALLGLCLGQFVFTPFQACDYLAAGTLFPTEHMDPMRPQFSETAAWFTYYEIRSFRHHALVYRTISFIAILLSGIFAGLIAMDILNRYGSRSSGTVALWTALFFVVERWNAQSLVSIAATPSVLSNLFGTAAVFLDLRFRLLKEPWYFWTALVALIGATILDLRGSLVALAGILLSRFLITQPRKRTISTLSSPVGSLLYILIVPLSMIPCQQVVNFSVDAGFLQSIQNLLATQVFTQNVDGLAALRIAFYAYVATAAGIGLFTGRDKPALFAVLWLVAALLCSCVTFTNDPWGWLKSPDFVSPLIFFAGPISYMIAMVPLRGLDTLERTVSGPLARLGSVALSVVFVIVAALMVSDLNRYGKTAQELDSFKTQLMQQLDVRKNPTLVVNPPFRRAGYLLAADGGIVTAPFSLVPSEKIMSAMLRRPLSKIRHSGYLFFATDYGMLAISRTAPKPAKHTSPTFRWNSDLQQLERIKYKGYSKLLYKQNFENVETEPLSAPRLTMEMTTPHGEKPWVQYTESALRAVSGRKEPLTIWLPPVEMDPSVVRGVNLATTDTDETFGDRMPLMLVWKGTLPGNDQAVNRQFGIPFKFVGKGDYFATTLSDPQWLQSPTIVQVGIRVPEGGKGVVIQQIETFDEKTLPF